MSASDGTTRRVGERPAGAFKDAYRDFFAVINAYSDFFELFGQREQGFIGFVDFFHHLQDLVTPDYKEFRFYLPFDNFKRSGTPATTPEYIEYRENVLAFIKKRSERMAKWVKENHSEIEVRHTD